MPLLPVTPSSAEVSSRKARAQLLQRPTPRRERTAVSRENPSRLAAVREVKVREQEGVAALFLSSLPRETLLLR